MITLDEHFEDINKIFGDSFNHNHRSSIKNILYHSGWTGYEEYAGLIIFEGVNGNIYYQDYFYCVLDAAHVFIFNPTLCTEEESIELMLSMENSIQEINNSI